MDTSIEEKIRGFGQKRDVENLKNVIRNLPTTELLNLIQAKLHSPNFSYVWNYILQGFMETSASHTKRFEVVMKLLKDLESNDIKSSHANPIMRRLCVDLPKFKPEHLVQMCEYCIQCLQSQRASQMSWKELMPEILNVVIERERIEYNDEEMTGVEFKHKLIDSMCVLQWFPSNITPLTEMFIEMPLTKEEHLQVVNKLGRYLEKMTPQEIPSFVYQFLRLCKNNNSRFLFFKLQHYFGVRLNQDLNQCESNSDDIENCIENAGIQDIVEAEGTILFHIHTAASLGHECIKDYLTSLKNMLRSPEVIIQSFSLNVLLTISTISHYEEKVFEIIRSCVSRVYHEEQKRTTNAWFREMVSSSAQIEVVFSHVIHASVQDRELVLQGLINFAFTLLGVGSALGRDPIAEKQWHLGNIILFKIIKRKRMVASAIVEQLSNRIVTCQTIAQYIECMYTLSTTMTLLMLENKSTIITLMEGLVQMPGNNAKQLLYVIIPIIKVSPTIRDHFILLLRKALYSRTTETRQVAVIGFLKLLTSLKISHLAALSQSSFSGSFSSGHSMFTQLSISRASQYNSGAFSNEALCLEVLSILKRCFMQPAEVRIQLYEGLYDAVCLNPELGIPVLEMLWWHFQDFYNLDEDSMPPLKFEKITATKDVNVTLQEPLGKLVYTIGLIISKIAKTNSENATVMRFNKILDSLCSRMINCELIHFELDDGTDLSDVLPESQQKLFVLKEAMCVYEALIGYQFHCWEFESENNGKTINGLFQGYSRLLHFLKDSHKPKKAATKKKIDSNKTTQTRIDNTTLKKETQKSSKTLKLPDTLLDFQVMVKILSLLHEKMVSWTTIVQASVLRSKKDFHQHMMQATLNLMTSIKNKKFVEAEGAKLVYGYLCDIAMIIYERVVKRLPEFADFDCTTAILALECFLVILNITFNNFKSNLQSFLSRVGGRDRAENLVSHLSELVETFHKSFETDEEETSQDPEIKKLPPLIINCLNFLLQHIPATNNSLALKIIDWSKNYAQNNTVTLNKTATGFVNYLFDSHLKFKVSLTFFEHVATRLGDVTGVINEEEHSIEGFKMINEQTVTSIVTSLCNIMKTVLEDIEWVIARLRAEHTIIIYLGESSVQKHKERLKTKERGVCCQLCFVVTFLTNISNCTVPPGNLSEAILKNLTLLYCTLSSLTKYFILRSSKLNPEFQTARFERLVKLAGKQLTPVVYKLIMYIEESQKQVPESTQKKKKSVDSSTLKSKVLKETRLIPKVVYEIEQFSKFVVQLSKKTKIDLSKFMGQGIVRDFRILHLKEVLEQAGGAAPTQNTQGSDGGLKEDDENVAQQDDDVSPPPAKKRK